jgi:hypothetical protein
MGENVSTLAISERCHCYGIILKSPKRLQAADGPLSADSVGKVGLPKLPDH